MSAKDFRERIEGLKAVEALVPQLASAPEGPLVQLLDSMTVSEQAGLPNGINHV